MHNDNKLSALIDGVHAAIDEYEKKSEGVSNVVLYGLQFNGLVELALKIKRKGDALVEELQATHAPRALPFSERVHRELQSESDYVPPRMMNRSVG